MQGSDRRFIKGRKYTLLASRKNLTSSGRADLQRLLKKNKRLYTAYLLKESFEHLWSFRKEAWAAPWRFTLKSPTRNQEDPLLL
jgi:transposase